MKSNMDIKEIWNNQKIIEPSINEFFKMVSNFKKKYIKSIILANAFLILTSAVIVFIWVYFQPQYITTKIGIITIIFSMLIYIIALNKTILFYQEKFNLDNNQYLFHLIQIKNKQHFLQNTMMKIYFILLSAGLGLYLIEYTQKMSLFLGITAYFATLFWIALNWFYFRPKIIKKQNLKIDELISRVEEISRQIY